MSDSTTQVGSLSLTETRHIVKDLFAPNPRIYWADFLFSITGGSICFVLAQRVFAFGSLPWAIAFLGAGLLYYRAAMFNHELVHLNANRFGGFRVAWNLMCGIPFLMPSFMYYTHVDHHMRKHYGTDLDGEYLPLGNSSPWQIVVYLCQPLVLPAIAVVRFLVFAPLGWISPSFRRFVHQRASSMVMDPMYIRPLPSPQVLRVMRLQEALCFLWTVGVATVLTLGLVPMRFLFAAYSMSVILLYFNSFRTLAAHRYFGDGQEMTFTDQLLDSVNYPRATLGALLMAPVGLRYHALHHLCPSLPYHNLGRAHRRLMAELPVGSPYRQTNSHSMLATVTDLWRRSLQHGVAAQGGARKKRHKQVYQGSGRGLPTA